MIDDFAPSRRPFTGRKMLLTIVGFFAVIIAVNLVMLLVSVNSFGGLVVKNSYVASQRFNEDVAAARAQPIRGWDIAALAGAGGLEVTVQDGTGHPISGLSLSASVARPTHERETRVLGLSEMAMGVYAANEAVSPGRWIVTLSTADGQTRSLDLFVKRPEAGSGS